MDIKEESLRQAIAAAEEDVEETGREMDELRKELDAIQASLHHNQRQTRPAYRQSGQRNRRAGRIPPHREQVMIGKHEQGLRNMVQLAELRVEEHDDHMRDIQKDIDRLLEQQRKASRQRDIRAEELGIARGNMVAYQAHVPAWPELVGS